jgi:hypothetical protein
MRQLCQHTSCLFVQLPMQRAHQLHAQAHRYTVAAWKLPSQAAPAWLQTCGLATLSYDMPAAAHVLTENSLQRPTTYAMPDSCTSVDNK